MYDNNNTGNHPSYDKLLGKYIHLILCRRAGSTLKEMEVHCMTHREVIKSMEDSVIEFNILEEPFLIGMIINTINKMEQDDKNVTRTILASRQDIVEYDMRTNHKHARDVAELLFKIDLYLNCKHD